MDITGTYTFAAPPQRVWTLLMDPEAIASCIPGWWPFDPAAPDRHKAGIPIAMAAITGNYEGTVAISDKVEPSSYKLTVSGQGRPGFVKGDATISLRSDDAGTIVDVKGTV